jgi:2-methylcitrate dehydratase PrpD
VDGITGTRRTLEGNAGLAALYERNEVRPELLFEGLGREWRILEYSFKPYPCCRCNHTAIGLGIRLHADGVRPEAVASAEIGLGHVNWLTVGEPYDAKRDSVVHAQFNAAYGFARALANGRVDLRTYQRPRITDPGIAALAARVRTVSDPDIGATAIEPARVRVNLLNGRSIEVSSSTIKGSPAEPMIQAELMGKYYDCMEFGLAAGPAAAKRLADCVSGIENSADVARDVVTAFPLPAGSTA